MQPFKEGDEWLIVAQKLCEFLNQQEQLNLKTEEVGKILRRYQVFEREPRRKWVTCNGEKVQRVCYWFSKEKLEACIQPFFQGEGEGVDLWFEKAID